jgi:hypothetical protein
VITQFVIDLKIGRSVPACGSSVYRSPPDALRSKVLLGGERGE